MLRLRTSLRSPSPLALLRTYAHPRPHPRRTYASAAPHKKQQDPWQQFEAVQKEHARILQVVQFKVALARQTFDEHSDASKSDARLSKLLKNSGPLTRAWQRWLSVHKSLDENRALLALPDLKELAEDEQSTLLADLSALLTRDFPALLVPPPSTGAMSALIELKAGVGGSESSLFCADLLRMYTRYAHARGWAPAVVSANASEQGGFKDAILEITGAGAYEALRAESGVHRVQRVPATESSGRVHTSTVAAVVLPLSEDAEAEKEDDLFNMDDVRIEVMRARGAGGQHVNKTESAVRLTHVPTGITVSMQDERSQHQNRRRAFQVLRARLMDQKLIREQAERRAARRNLVRTADRSEKIRTYNYPQDRVTDHRVGKLNTTWGSVMEGDALEDIVLALKERQRLDALEEVLTEAEEMAAEMS